VVRVFDTTSGLETARFTDHKSSVWGVAFSPDGKLAASGGGNAPHAGDPDGAPDYAVRLWDPTTGKLIRSMPGHTALVRRVAFTPDGKKLVSCGFDGFVRVWSVPSGELVREIEVNPGKWVEDVRVSPDGKRILTCGGGPDNVKVWDLATGRNLT